MKLPYVSVAVASPFLYVITAGIDLTKIVTTGDTYLSVYRVQNNQACITPPTEPDDAAHYMPIGYVAGNKFTFAMDNTVFNQAGGRFRGDLYYKGTYIDSLMFVYNKLPISAVASSV